MSTKKFISLENLRQFKSGLDVGFNDVKSRVEDLEAKQFPLKVTATFAGTGSYEVGSTPSVSVTIKTERKVEITPDTVTPTPNSGTVAADKKSVSWPAPSANATYRVAVTHNGESAQSSSASVAFHNYKYWKFLDNLPADLAAAIAELKNSSGRQQSLESGRGKSNITVPAGKYLLFAQAGTYSDLRCADSKIEFPQAAGLTGTSVSMERQNGTGSDDYSIVVFVVNTSEPITINIF